MENIGLKDKFGVEITNGCIVELTGSLKARHSKGERFKCVWNTTQHRYGFMHLHHLKMSYKDMEKVILNPTTLDCHFYATPKNASKLKVIS